MKKVTGILLVIITILFSSCEDVLFEENITLSTLIILAPKDSTIVRSNSLLFSWTKVQGATSYQLQIATPNFEEASQIVIDMEVDGNTYTEDLPKNNYEWRVRAKNSGYNGPFSFANFKVEDIEDFSSNRISLLAPEDDFVTNKTNVLLEWREIENAAVYRVQIKKDGNLISEETTAENLIDLQFPEGEFIWRVRAENETQITFYSERKILIDTLSPNIPKLLEPTDNASLSLESVTFDWERDDLEGSVEIDSLFVFKDLELQEQVKKEQVNISYNTILDRQETYYWFMKSYDEAGNESDESEVFSFTIN